MKSYLSLILIIFFFFHHTNANKLFGNLVFFGRGLRDLPKYWNEIEVTKNSYVYFPYSKYDSDQTNLSSSSDEAKNYPLVIFLSEKNDKEYSEVRFEIEKNDYVKLNDYTYFKSEIKFRIPKSKYLINDGYTCEKLQLPCTSLDKYDFSNNNEWLDLIDFKIFLEDYSVKNDNTMTENDKKKISYELKDYNKITTEWQEINVKIDSMDKEYNYTSLVFRNYGNMPVYVSLGNTMFVKSESDDSVIIKNGIFQDGFEDWSWYQKTDDDKPTSVFHDKICPIDPEQKNSIYLATKTNYDFGLRMNVKSYSFGPPEAISFKYRPMKDSQLTLTLNENLTLSINEYLINRNCDINPQEEITILVDIKYYILTDSKLLMNNDITGMWIQTVTDVEGIKKYIYTETQDEKLRDEYVEDIYFYDLTFHHCYPTNLEAFHLEKLYSTGECDLTLHSHDYILNLKRRWPEDVAFEKMFKSKNIIKYEEKIITSGVKKNLHKYEFIIKIGLRENEIMKL
ncbi:hypothetical protein BCR32DRAFT_293567 [Anaeromyces robustus]|uniref:Uncharacterized protein n=1 Tax=Anaeromyces robustus TaxID=1754192 RepID=A0A1Y1X533_9FUNG|nr:hypothetical protein BCR32DRAFT_293567 [Anaeromyces robustus]|eukprot:ORX80927.1 hypothetical protein BCR32DRAFT_293567 [Anaeromyces robustus]